MNHNPQTMHPFRPLVSRLALTVFTLGMLLPAAPGRSADRAPRQIRVGSPRGPGGSAQRNGACGVECESPDRGFYFRLAGPPAPLATSAPAAGDAATVASPVLPVATATRDCTVTLAGELGAPALRPRPQTPTFGRPPPRRALAA